MENNPKIKYKCPFCYGKVFYKVNNDFGDNVVKIGLMKIALKRYIICGKCGTIVRTYIDDTSLLKEQDIVQNDDVEN